MVLSSTEYQIIFQNFKVARSCEAYISNDGWNRFWQSILWIPIWWIHNSSRLSLVWWCRYTKVFTRSTSIMMPYQGDVITAPLCRESPSPTTTTHKGPVRRTFEISFNVSLIKLLNEQLNCRCRGRRLTSHVHMINLYSNFQQTKIDSWARGVDVCQSLGLTLCWLTASLILS